MTGRVLCVVASVAVLVTTVGGASSAFADTGSSPSSASAASAPEHPAAQSSADRPTSGPEAVAADGELVGLRTATSRTFVTAGGRQLRAYAQQVNVRDAGGRWQKADESLTAAADGRSVHPRLTQVEVLLPAGLTEPVRVGSGAPLSMTLLGASSGSRSVRGSEAFYTAVLPSVDATYAVQPGGVKETLVLADAAAPGSFRFQLAAAGATFGLRRDGSVAVTDAAGGLLYSLPAPTIRDSSATSAGADSSEPVRYALSGSQSPVVLTVSVTPAWLGDAARVFPVLLDPSVYAPGPAAATYLNSGAPTTNYSTATTLKAGNGGGSTFRSLVRYDLSALPRHVDVISSEVQGDVTANSTGATTTILAQPLSRAWTSAATWNSYDGTNAWTSAGGDVTAGITYTSEPISPAIPSLYDLVTKTAQGWADGSVVNNGLLLSTPASPATVLDLTKQVASAGSPYLNISYTPHTGDRGFYSFYDQSLTDRMGVKVNLASGDLRVVNNDLAIAGNGGLDLAVGRFYDSTADTRVSGVYPLPEKWKLTPGRDLQLNQYEDGKLLTGPSGFTAWFAKTIPGSPSTAYVTPPGIAADLTGSPGALVLRMRSSGLKYTFGDYDLLTSISDRNNNTISFAYSTPLSYNSTVTSMTDTRGRTVTLAYAGGRLASMTDSIGRVWSYSYDPTYTYLTGYTDPNSKSTTYGYDAAGLLAQIVDPNGYKTNLTYDSAKRVTSIMRVTSTSGTDTGPTTSFAYTDTSVTYTDSTGAVFSYPGKTVVTDANSRATTHYYDSSDRVTRTVDALGHTRSKAYTANSDVSSAVDGMGTGTSAGNSTAFAYDGDSRPTSSTAPTGAASATTYTEAAGTVTNQVAHWQPATATDPDGSKSSFTYDGPGNVTTSTDSTTGGTGTSTAYGIFGNTGVAACGGRTGQTGQVCTATDGNGKITTNHYNTLGELDLVTPPAPLGTTSYTYDGASRLSSVTDGKAQVTRYNYDNLDRVVQTRFNNTSTCTSADISAGNCITNATDDDGNITSTLDQTGTISYGYDRLNRETSRSLPSTGTTSLSYDGVGNVLTATDAAGTITYGYDNANELTSLLEPGGSCTAVPKDRCTTFGYNNNGVRTTTTYPTGTTSTVMTLTPDASGRVGTIKAVTGATVQSDLSYTYSRMVGSTPTDGVLTQTRTDNQASGATGKTTSYLYDSLSRLKSAVEKDNLGTQTAAWTYVYDGAGNRTSATLSPAGTGAATAFTYNNANEIMTRAGAGGFSYDANGAETAAVGATTRTTGAWNPKQQNTSSTVGGTAQARTYTGTGNNLRLTAGSTSYRNTALGLTAQTASGSTTTFIRDPDGTLVGVRAGTTTCYYIFDGLGSVVALISPTGVKANTYTYDPYGQARTATGTFNNPYRYTGGYLDTSTGLYKLGIRYYDPTLGRFTQLDPTGKSAHYVYGNDNPVVYVDPGGAYVSIPAGYTYDPSLGPRHDYCTKVPDAYRVPGRDADFQGPCATHDLCYDANGTTSACNRALYADLRENCGSAYGRLDARRYDCYRVAAVYYGGVVLAHL